MFNFTTQTILNSVGSNVIVSEGKNPVVRIGNIRFKKPQIIEVFRKKATPENLAEVTFDLDAVDYSGTNEAAEKTGRIVLYLSLSMSSQDALYANDFVYKGKPLYIEFSIKKGETPASIATKVKNNAEKYFLFTMGSEKILTVTKDGSKVTFKGVNGYQQITTAKLQVFNPSAKVIDCCSNQGDYEDVVVGVQGVYYLDSDGKVQVQAGKKFDGSVVNIESNEVVIKPGLEAFGDYNWIIHNLRLPTCANTSFFSPNKEEMPVVGQTYNQYTIRICADREGISGSVVGAKVTSVTTHVFYVATPYVSTFETALAKALDGVSIEDNAKDSNPYGVNTTTTTNND